MDNVLARKLEAFGPLPDDDRCLLDAAVSSPRLIGADEDIVREGDPTGDVHLVVEGFACRYKLLKNGDRQIVAFLVPGDICDMHVFILRAMDHSIATLSPARVVDIPRARILEMTERPALARAFWWATLVDEAILREWLLNIGQREAEGRIAHLICELHARLKLVGLADGDRFALPITQAEIGDALGLSAIHVNRSLQSLRAQNLLTLRYRELVILDPDRLRTLGEFTPNYLHLAGGKRDRPSEPAPG
ncbi:Crp/Fnr family transcriptional regulator [Enterovirga rhinocerotis]|uniref:CRP-like cAMP-binding protein n=1 Tax=Enterovirga rhinocerotis TaxID=1339210 RepID=A0A4R7BN12_9HYPH|nr:Crp/Fnr family transcriptional regulator [Enterovirga rhinocerotis]TDR85307.1 CRP-like cAMP-binding protein [Enterovirga rhinocerotis]